MSIPESSSSSKEDYKIELLPEDYPQYDLSFKLILLGDCFVGKSSLTKRAIKNEFEEYYSATIGFDFLTFNIKINDKICKLQIWDTCGTEVYKSLISNFYKNSSLACLIYAINNKESFRHVETWLKNLKNEASDKVRIILVGNKADLEEERRISKEEGLNYKEKLHLDLFMETSAKTGQNVKNILVEAAKILYKDYLNYNENDKDGVDEGNQDKKGQDLIKEDKKDKKGCC